jgi:hypothetical protein
MGQPVLVPPQSTSRMNAIMVTPQILAAQVKAEEDARNQAALDAWANQFQPGMTG